LHCAFEILAVYSYLVIPHPLTWFFVAGPFLWSYMGNFWELLWQ